MPTSIERILTTHTGSLPRPQAFDRHDPNAVRAAVADTAQRQRTVGIDLVNDGEVSKSSYATYVTERLTGFGGDPASLALRGFEHFPEFAAKTWGDPQLAAVLAHPTCDGPVTYVGHAQVEADISNLEASDSNSEGLFLSAASPGVIEMFLQNRYYPNIEDYLSALADAMKEEYDAIAAAGLVIQIDCPDLACAWALGPEQTIEEFRKIVALRLEAIDHATRDIPAEQLRLHLCWGNYEGPHHTDIPLAAIIDLVLDSRPAGISFEAANPRHEHEWKLFEDVKLPDGKYAIPGVIDSTTNFIEHPELVAQRIGRYAGVVGRENVVAGTDCGFATFASFLPVDPRIAWEKLAALVEGARLASAELW